MSDQNANRNENRNENDELTRLRERVDSLERALSGSFATVSGLQASEEMFRLLVTHMPDVAWTSDRDGRTIYISPRILDLCGCTPEECCSAKQEPWFSRVHPDDRERAEQAYRDMFDRGATFDTEYRLRRKDGSWVWVHHRAVSGMTKEGELHARGVIRDISGAREARDALRRSEEKFRDLFDNAMDAIFIVDADFRYVDVNKRATELFGYSKEEFLAMRIFDVIPPDQVNRSAKELARLKEQGRYEQFRGKLRTRDGRWRDIEVNSSAIIESGEIVGSRDIVRDITDQVATQQEVAGSEQLLRSIIDAAPFGAHLYELQERDRLVFLGANRAADRILGVDNSQFVGKIIEEAFPPLQSSEIPERYRAAARDGTPYAGEQVSYEHGQIRGVYEVVAAPIGRNRMAAFFRDVSEQKKAEERLREEKNRSEAIIAAIGDGISIQDREFRILYQNDVHKGFVGSHVGEQCYRAYEFRDETCEGCPVALAFRDGRVHVTERFLDRPEGRRFFEISASPLRDASGKIVAGIEAVRDITERKRSLEALREAEEKLRDIIEHSTNLFYMHTADHLLVYVSPQSRWFFDCEPEEALVNWKEFLTDNPVNQRGIELTQQALETGVPQASYELEIKTMRGRRLWVEVHEAPIVREDGTVAIVGALTDITRRKQAEEDERRSREQLQQLIDRMPVACIMWDTAFRVSLWNPMAEQIFGYSAAEALGRHASELIVPEKDRPTVRLNWDRVLAGDQAAHSVNGNRTKDGSEVQCEWFNMPLHDPFGVATGMLSMVNDVTERIRAEEERQKLQGQLLQSQKMEAIGLLAGGVAHDFNNILSAVLGYASIIELKMRPEDPLRTHVEQVIAAAKRAASLTQSLLAFSRKQIINPRPLELNEGIRKSEKLLRRLIGEDIEFVTRYHEELVVLADPTQIEQVVINLATNARDAMPRGGTLSITTDRAEIDDVFIRDHGFGAEGSYALMTVSDTGQGIDEETRVHIFEPFFTTKEPGKGTGLGLSTVYGIVKQSRGFVLCESIPGAGTTFRVYLPLTRTREAARDEAKPEDMPRGTETILIAEDDTATRGLFEALFTEHGYRVIAAANGEEAVERFRERAAEIRLLVLDVIMPRKNGREVFEAARAIRPDVKVLFTSGYTADIIQSRKILDPGTDFITKPVAPGDLLQKARAVLDE